jgi:hypothetical protein
MSSYSDDTLTWAKEQAALLRRLANGERVNDQVDWPNVIEEVESVGRSELRAVTSGLKNAMQHKLYLLGWPNALAAQHWRTEIGIQLAETAKDFRDSMRQEIEQDLPGLYRLARLRTEAHVLDGGPPAVALPKTCPWSLAELLAEGSD